MKQSERTPPPGGMRKHGPAGAFLRRKNAPKKEDVRRRNGGKAGVLPLGPRRGAAVTGTANVGPWGPMTGQPGFAAGEMRPDGSKGRGFAVGAPARRSRDGNGKTAVRGGEAMAAKRTTAQGGFAQRNAARDFARQTQKAGPMTGQPGFAAGEMRPNGSKGRVLPLGPRRGAAVTGTAKRRPLGADDRPARFRRRRNATEREQGPGRNGSRVWERGRPPLSRGRLRNLPMALLS